jgi:hypothetical protein
MTATLDWLRTSKSKLERDLIVERIIHAEPVGITLGDLEAAVCADFPYWKVTHHIELLVERGTVYLDEGSPRRVHVCD